MNVHDALPRTTTTPYPPTWMLNRLRPLSRWLIRRRYDVQVHGAEWVPATGPVIFAANHIGVIDGPLLAVYAPRTLHALTKIEMFSGRLGWFLRHTGQIPLDRDSTDPRAVKLALRVLRDGGAVGIFPEGHRGAGELERFHRGAAYLALVTGAPIVPVSMIGTRDPGGHTGSIPPRGRCLELVFAAPYSFDPTPWPRRRDDVEQASLELRERMLHDLREALAATGRSLPGPLPAGEQLPDPSGGVTGTTT
ncbi:1-acyl-sn-glycerol-3-phosphate acyltransferase [Nocardioides psychrotolerans]|uniref:1-acyl-sn-glycerol-3-phosphate acyltransferase n=1 Tax=Nocardioides psychrotolerans TaxID=1005945 RepID=A0A1I3NMN3_9ACTN|nr:lysophospholipid acyltransferase family protein [Nocardioides psychrotolerans]GEP39405.1 1-acyl-sn-glycerol-3-phosphate acyltransferase [Nocardioides psychrotolerans]SFJ10475.1 1-acyl-sn-glycerol-3-phosphate acyltransferase [Nocardioides psychrotolerans]